MIVATAASPLKARLLSSTANTSVWRVPALRSGKIDLSRTVSGATGEITLTNSDLDAMVANFGKWTMPVSVGFDGMEPMGSGSNHGRDLGGPKTAFVLGLIREGDVLYADVECRGYSREVIEGYRATSGEAAKDPVLTSGDTLGGWVFTGMIFTNRNALDTVYEIAASAASVRGSIELGMSTPHVGGSTNMPDPNQPETVSLAWHKDQVASKDQDISARDAQIGALNASLAAANERASGFERKVAELSTAASAGSVSLAEVTARANRAELDRDSARKALELSGTALSQRTVELEAERAKLKSIEVRQLILAAIDKGVPPATFDGHEGDPAAFAEATFGSIEGLKRYIAVASVPAVPGKDVALSGHNPAAIVEDPTKISAEEKATLAKHNIGTSFVGVTTEAEARAIAKQLAAKAKGN